MAQDNAKKKRFGAAPASSAVDIDAFINGSATDSQEKVKHDKTITAAPTAPTEAPVAEKPAEAVVVQPPVEVKSTQAPAVITTTPAEKPKRGRPAKVKPSDDEQDEEGKPVKFLFELPFKENDALREYAYVTRKSKAEILRQALKEYLKRNQ